MAFFGNNIVTVTMKWTNFKAMIASKSLAIQYDFVQEDKLYNHYQIFSSDVPILYVTDIWSGTQPPGVVIQTQAENDSFYTDFATNFQPFANRSVSPIASIQDGDTTTRAPLTTMLVGGSDGVNLRPFSVDSVGRLNVSTAGPTGSISPLSASLGGGVDISGILRPIRVDSSGNQFITGSVGITNFPAIQTITGSVGITGIPTITGSVTIDSHQLPASLVGGRLDENIGAWLGSTTPTVGQKTMASSIPVVLSSDQSAIPITGSITATNPSVSANASAIPGYSTQVGGSDGTNLQAARVFDVDTGGGTQFVLGVELRKAASGGSVEAGTSADPLRIDPTGTTAQPITDNAGSLTVDSPQLPAALVGGRLDENIGAWLGSTAPTVGSKTSANSVPVVIASDQGAVPVSGTITANIGTSGALALDATLTGGTAKAIVRGGAKGATTAADVTSTSIDADHNALDVAVKVSALPTGAATETTLGTRLADSTFTGRINTLGQKTMANSTPMVLASDQTVIPVSDNAGSLTVDSPQLPSALVGGRLDENIGAWLGSTAPTVGSKTSANSVPVVIASDQGAVAVSGTVTANQGSPAITANAWPAKITDGTNVGTVKAASTAAIATDTAIVVALSPNNPITLGASTDTVGTPVALNALDTVASVALAGQNTIGMFLGAGTLVGTIQSELSYDGGTTWVAATFVDPATGTRVATLAFTNPNAATSRTIFGYGGATHARVRVNPYTSGTATATLRATSVNDQTSLQLPAALVGGRLDENIGAWLGSTAPTVGSKTSTNSVPVVIASDQGVIPVSDNASSLTVDAPVGTPVFVRLSDGSTAVTPLIGAQLPAALVGGRLDENVGAWLGSTAPTVGSKTSANSVPVVIASDQGAVTVTGTVTATNASVSTNNAAAPGSSTQIGGTDGANLQSAHVFDLDTGGGTEYDLGVGLRISGAGGSIEAKGQKVLASSIPVAIASDQTVIPVSDNAGSLTVDSAQLPAALVGGRLDENIGAWLGSTAPTVGSKTSANSVPVVIASDQGAVAISGTVTANIGTSGALALDATLTNRTNKVRQTDGTNDITTLFDADSGAGSQYLQGVSLRKTASGGSVEAGTSSDPLRIDPTGTTAQPITDNAGSLTIDSPQLPAALVGGRLDENIGAWLGSTAPTVGQKTMANSVPVVIASDQSAVPVSGTVTANIGTSGALALDATLTGGTQKAIVRGGAKGATVAADVTSTSFDADHNSLDVAVKVSALPTGAATEATLATRLADATFTARINTLGQKTMANSTPVVLASDQTSIPTTFADTVGSGVALNATDAAASVALGGQNTIGMFLAAGTLAGTIQPELSYDGGTTWVAATFIDPATGTRVTTLVFTNPNAATSRTIFSYGGVTHARVRVNPYTSGTATATLRATTVNDQTTLQLPAALVGSRLDTNTGAWLGSTAPTVGSKTSANSVPVVIASDQGAIAISAASLPLPTGASTEATLATRLADATFTGRINTLGQKTMANSTPMVLASDQTVIPVSDNASSLTVDAPVGTPVFVRLSDGAAAVTPLVGAQLPAALVGGRLDENVGAWLGSTAPTVGSKTSANSVPVVIASDQGAVTVSGTVTATNPSVGTNNAAIPASSTQVGGSDGTNLQAARVFDADTGGGTQYVLGAILRKSASGGSVEAGTSADPLRIDPTGTTAQPITDNAGTLTVDAPVATPVFVRLSDGAAAVTPLIGAQLPAALVGGRLDENIGAWLGSTAPTVGQKAMANSVPVAIASDQTVIPVSDNAGSLTVDSPQLPAALVGGRLDENVGAWLGSTAPTVGSKTSANSVPVVIASDQGAVSVSGTVTANQGTPAVAGNAWPSKIVDSGGVNVATVKAASTAAIATDTAIVVALSPNNPVTLGAATDTVGSSIALNALNVTAQVALAGQNSAGVFIAAGTLAGLIVAEISFDGGTTWVPTIFMDPANRAKTYLLMLTDPGNLAISKAIICLGGATHARVRVLQFVSGTATATLRATAVIPNTDTVYDLNQNTDGISNTDFSVGVNLRIPGPGGSIGVGTKISPLFTSDIKALDANTRIELLLIEIRDLLAKQNSFSK